MWNGFIGQSLAATNKNLRRCSMVLFAIAVLMGLYGARQFFNVLRGPATYDEAQLVALPIQTYTLRNYATVHGTSAISTAITEVETTTENGAVQSKRTTGEYMALVVGSHLLIVKALPGAKAETYTGAIVPLPDDLKKELFSDPDDHKVEAATFPLMLDASEDYADGLILGCIGVGLLLVCSLWLSIKSKRRSENPELHPLCKALSKYGPLYTLVPAIDEEAQTARSVIGGVTFTRNWIISCWMTHSLAMRRDEIVWVYKKRTKHRVNFIPTGTSYSLVIRDARGKLLDITSDEATVGSYLTSLAEQTPWVVFGYDKKLEKLYKKQRPAFVTAVSERKASVEASGT